jgi:ADP-heptose:LPS heptosyltransferase
MKKILLSLSSRKLRNGNQNSKDYPYSNDLIELLKKEGFITVQVRTDNDPILNTDEVKTNLSLKNLAEIIKECDTFISVDNFIHHYAAYLNKKGVVAFSKSDPLIFGHSININLLKSRNYLKKNQFGIWEEEDYVKDAFVDPELIVKHVKKICEI